MSVLQSFISGTSCVLNFLLAFAMNLSMKLFWNHEAFWSLLHTH